jgi:hypothetical protein
LLQDRGGFYFGFVIIQNFEHGGAGEVDASMRESFGDEMTTGMLGVDKIEVGNVINDPPVDLLRDVEVETAIAGLHMKDWNMKPLGYIGGKAGVGVAEDNKSVWFHFSKQFPGFSDDISYGCFKG